MFISKNINNEVRSPSEIKKIATIIYDNGNIYEGEIQNNMRNGTGKLTFKKSGDIYEGSFINNQRDGYGTYIYNGNQEEEKRNGKNLQKYKGKIKI